MAAWEVAEKEVTARVAADGGLTKLACGGSGDNISMSGWVGLEWCCQGGRIAAVHACTLVALCGTAQMKALTRSAPCPAVYAPT